MSPADPQPDPSVRRRGRLEGRRIGAATFLVLVIVAVGSISYNAVTAARAGPPPGARYITADSIRTRYVTWGDRGTPIVLIHGAFESADTWDRLSPLLAPNHRVYALDVTGWGYSGHRGPYTAARDTAQLLAFLAALRLHRPLLVGHSTGAAVIGEATLEAPTRIGGVVFLDGDGLPGGGPPHLLLDLLTNPLRTTLLRLLVRSDATIRRVYATECGPRCPRLTGAELDTWRRPLQVPGAEKALWSMLRSGIVGVPTVRLGRLRGLPIPKAVVFGAEDGVFPGSAPSKTARLIGAPPPTIIAKAHHLALISDPAPVAAVVESMARTIAGR